MLYVLSDCRWRAWRRVSAQYMWLGRSCLHIVKVGRPAPSTSAASCLFVKLLRLPLLLGPGGGEYQFLLPQQPVIPSSSWVSFISGAPWLQQRAWHSTGVLKYSLSSQSSLSTYCTPGIFFLRKFSSREVPNSYSNSPE